MSIGLKTFAHADLSGSGMALRAEMKRWFFDSDRVKRLLEKRTYKVLRHFGGFVRKTSRNSLKSQPYGKIAAAGHAPFDHVGYATKVQNKERKAAGLPARKPSGLRGLKHIYFALNKGYRSVVIGPVAANAKGSIILPALEYGGRSRTTSGRHGKRSEITIKVRPHPFMQPAFDTGKRKLPDFWSQAH